MNHELELKLQAWLDGEMPSSEASRFEQTLVSDRETQQLLAELKSVKAALKDNEPVVKVPDSREFYFSQIQRRIQHESKAAPAPAPSFIESLVAHWRKLLVPVVGATAALTLLAVSVHETMPSPSFVETTDTASEMEALTFHDQSAGMTVVWLKMTDRPAPAPADFSDFFDVP